MQVAPWKRQKRPAQVLDEDSYSDAVMHIVARDFFPGILETEAQEELLMALESQNEEWINQARRRLQEATDPSSARRKRRRSESSKVDTNMSLGEFQAKYTSEDNDSFNAILDKQSEKRASNYAFFYNGNKIPSSRQLALQAREKEQLQGTSEGQLVKNADGAERTAVSIARPSENLDERPACVDSFPDRQGPRNNLMFFPNGIETNPPKSSAGIRYEATRLPNQTDLEARPPSPTMSAIDAAIARTEPSESTCSGSEIPRVNGFAYVNEEPTLEQLRAGSPFRIQERSRREKLHHRQVEKTMAAKRKQENILKQQQLNAGKTPAERMGSMTPAGRMLAASIATPRRGNKLGDVGRLDWTPR
ncbi:hypothetical protein K470DRAFT_246005 [Piedraia hortae CBS 480.64]|uniref:Uncharacterized protein n=1 Tax=Piedraia hortae CBS 480.64 TaxID=1314780 RepID=A0A6A7C194_9PEZI|nr:hypothetical protein K470DRAFT_246005 [Piedraia hortae CBS 480.64]